MHRIYRIFLIFDSVWMKRGVDFSIIHSWGFGESRNWICSSSWCWEIVGQLGGSFDPLGRLFDWLVMELGYAHNWAGGTHQFYWLFIDVVVSMCNTVRPAPFKFKVIKGMFMMHYTFSFFLFYFHWLWDIISTAVYTLYIFTNITIIFCYTFFCFCFNNEYMCVPLWVCVIFYYFEGYLTTQQRRIKKLFNLWTCGLDCVRIAMYGSREPIVAKWAPNGTQEYLEPA